MPGEVSNPTPGDKAPAVGCGDKNHALHTGQRFEEKAPPQQLPRFSGNLNLFDGNRKPIIPEERSAVHDGEFGQEPPLL